MDSLLQRLNRVLGDKYVVIKSVGDHLFYLNKVIFTAGLCSAKPPRYSYFKHWETPLPGRSVAFVESLRRSASFILQMCN